MQIILIALCLLFIVLIVLFVRDLYVKRKLQQLTWMKYHAIKGLIQKLTTKTKISEDEILTIAQIPSLRLALYNALDAYERKDLFPKEHYTEEKGAEAYLVNWLEFPTELGRAPDEILLLQMVPITLQVQMHYYVFKFRTSSPKWASKFGWMIGVCGPYNTNTLPFDIPEKVFSRFNPVGVVQPDVEVRWVHEHINS